MRLKLKYCGATSIVDIAEPVLLPNLIAVAASSFSLEKHDVHLHVGFPPFAALSSATDVRGGMVIDVRASPPMTRHAVPADNSCLFTAVAWLLALPVAPVVLRRSVADVVLSDTAAWSEAVLGRPPHEYANHICQPNTWGGGIELAILARAHACELAAIEIRSGTMYVFGEGEGFTRRSYLIFDGMHYDALARKDVCVFDASDAAARDAAAAFAALARLKREFTDLNGFSLRCGDCSKGLVGETAALEHAMETGHSNFQEFSPATPRSP